MHSSEFNKPELPALGIVAELDEDDRRLLSDYGEFLPLRDGANLIPEGSMSRRIRPMNENFSTAELEASIKHFFH